MNSILLKPKSKFNNRFDYCVIESPEHDYVIFLCKSIGKNEYNVTLYLACCNNDELIYKETCIIYSLDFEASSPLGKRGMLSSMLTTLESEENILYPELLYSRFGGSICGLYKNTGEA